MSQQEPTNLTAEQKERVEVTTATYLIRSGNPTLVRHGVSRLMNVYLKQLKADELDELGAWLLANRRTWWIQKVEEKVGGG